MFQQPPSRQRLQQAARQERYIAEQLHLARFCGQCGQYVPPEVYRPTCWFCRKIICSACEKSIFSRTYGLA
uniref:Uncharacterized protein n=1 Tax=Thermogemmatispora argillosa TaxID=2045280 RepID=A0A455T6F8_9CHLR|nr:hypothetical protein KTA_33680 [Thermogemmatispora argillosa]